MRYKCKNIYNRPIKDRILEKTKKTKSCWLWQGHKNTNGYGSIWHNKKTRLVHRLFWATFKGPIPEGTCLLHKCDNPPCINPKHLFLGTLSDNSKDRDQKKRGKDSRKTHCVRGHEFSTENTRLSGNRRKCIECMRARSKRWNLNMTIAQLETQRLYMKKYYKKNGAYIRRKMKHKYWDKK